MPDLNGSRSNSQRPLRQLILDFRGTSLCASFVLIATGRAGHTQPVNDFAMGHDSHGTWQSDRG